jgi:hypothetical protein
VRSNGLEHGGVQDFVAQLLLLNRNHLLIIKLSPNFSIIGDKLIWVLSLGVYIMISLKDTNIYLYVLLCTWMI